MRRAFQLHAQHLAQRTAAAIRSHDIVGFERVRFAVYAANVQRHACVVLPQVHHFFTQAKRDVRIAREARTQGLFRKLLHEDVAPPPAEFAPRRPDIGKASPVRLEHAQRHVLDNVAAQLVCESRGLEQTQRFVVDAHGARKLHDLWGLFNHYGVDAVQPQHVRHRDAIGPGAHDDD